MNTEINPFDILSGKVVQTEYETFYFKEAGINVHKNGAITGKLHRENDLPAAVFKNGYTAWWADGMRHRGNGPAIIRENGSESYFINGKQLSSKEFNEYVRNKPI